MFTFKKRWFFLLLSLREKKGKVKMGEGRNVIGIEKKREEKEESETTHKGTEEESSFFFSLSYLLSLSFASAWKPRGLLSRV